MSAPLLGCSCQLWHTPNVDHHPSQPCHTGSTSFTDYPLQQISYSTVDSIIQKDFDATDFDGSYAIYILNPAVKATYAYTYDTE